MPIDILMPALSPTMEEGNLAKWLKNEGGKFPFKPPAARQHDRPSPRNRDCIGNLNRRKFGAAGIEIGDDLHYGRPVCRHVCNLAFGRHESVSAAAAVEARHLAIGDLL